MRFVWGECELDREARVLTRAGAQVRTQPLVLDLLLLLLQHRGRVVSEERLRASLWPDTRVTDASLRRLLKETRRAIGDDGERQEQIQTVRGRGIRFAAPVETRDGWDTSFVGRTDVLAALEQKLEEVAGGLGGVTLLSGPAGMGKTRTLAELQARAAVRGFRILYGTGRAGAQEDAFHPWLEALREVDAHGLLPAGRDRERDSRPAMGDTRRFEAFRAFAQGLIQTSHQAPLLIGLDDLQLADHDTIALLRFVAPALCGTHVWVVGCFWTSGGRTVPLRCDLAALRAETSTQALSSCAGSTRLEPAQSHPESTARR
jgi:DNA-binding winged helix-turn-helix (wHTH) protein